MRKITFLFVFFSFYSTFLPIFGQVTLLFDSMEAPHFDWQEQILQQVDVEDLGEDAYQELLDELSDMVLWSDTAVQPIRIRQQIILSSNRTLNVREGYRNRTAQRQETSKAYLGDPWHHSFRYRIKAGSVWQAGFSLEKDAGEPWRKQIPGFDSWHGFVAYRAESASQPWLKQAVLGHYRLRTGCGLLINQGFSLGKQYHTQQLQQQSNTITPVASNAEDKYMQGIAFRIQAGRHFTLLPYCSALQIDGTLNNHILSAIKTDGLHQTLHEAQRRNAAWQSIFGTRAGWRGEWYDVGLHLMTTHLQYDYKKNTTYYNQSQFQGHQLTQASADYQFRALGFVLRGETAISDNGSMAMLNYLDHDLGRYWNASIIQRYYSRQYQQLHASSLSESSAMQGEQGLTFNLAGSLTQHWDVQLMADYFYFNQPQFGIREERSDGVEAAIKAIRHHERSTLSIGYRVKRKGNYIRHLFDSYLTLTPTEQLSFRTQFKGRIYSEINKDPSYGYAFSQAATWQSSFHNNSCPYTLHAQATYFSTDDYDSRVYMTEKTLLYGFGLPIFFGQGLRYSIVGNVHLGSHLVIELKWALTNYANRTTISSGLQEIKGNTQQDLWLQARIKL